MALSLAQIRAIAAKGQRFTHRKLVQHRMKRHLVQRVQQGMGPKEISTTLGHSMSERQVNKLIKNLKVNESIRFRRKAKKTAIIGGGVAGYGAFIGGVMYLNKKLEQPKRIKRIKRV